MRDLTRRNRPGRFAEKIAALNRFLTGWMNYYRYARCGGTCKTLDGWIRRKLRVIKLKQLKRRYTVARFYRRQGVPEYQAWIGALSGKGYWTRSGIPQSHQAMHVQWFTEQGLVNLFERWRYLQSKP